MRKHKSFIYPIIFLVLAFSSIKSYSQNYDLWGVTKDGGKYSGGTIFKLDSNGRHFKNVHDFYKIDAKGSTISFLMEGGDSNLLGITSGGPYNSGVLFKYDTINDTFLKVLNFNSKTIGSNPSGGLVQANSGLFYGMCSSGGKNSGGTIFEYDPQNDSIKVLFDFIEYDSNLGSQPYGGLVLDSNKVYGFNYSGGNYGIGCIFEYDLVNNTLRVVHHFRIIDPRIDGIVMATNGNLFAVTQNGGNYYKGSIFEFDIIRDTLSLVYSFNDSLGAYPTGKLVVGSNGNLFGLTRGGGAYGFGVLFEFDVVNQTYNKRIDFDNSIGYIESYSKMIETNNGRIYWLNFRDGPCNRGTILEFDLNTDSLKYFGFGCDSSNFLCHPSGYLSGYLNGKIFGIASRGSSNSFYGFGGIFSFNILTKEISDEIYFNDDREDGVYPNSPLVLSPDGKFYGTTLEGGSTRNGGVLFSFDPINNSFQKKLNFPDQYDHNKKNNLLIDENGIVYGSYSDTFRGIHYYQYFEDEIFYKYSPQNDSIINIYRSQYSYNEGEEFGGDMVLWKDNKVYGTGRRGGLNNDGVIFSYDPVSDTLIVVHHFDGNNGEYPCFGVALAKNRFLLGMTRRGGYNDAGILYKFDLITKQFSVILSFKKKITGYSPSGVLKKGQHAKYYGMMYGGGLYDNGTLYEYDIDRNIYKVLYHFEDSLGSPEGAVTMGPNGKLYGCLIYSSTYKGYGNIFEYDIQQNKLVIVHQFNGLDGNKPLGNLIVFDKCIYHFDTVSITACDTFYSPGGKILTSTQTFNETLKNIYGCDSVVIINLTINQSDFLKFDTIVCDSFISPAGRILTNSGFYIDSFKNYRTCDSLISFNLTVNKKSKVILEKMACDSFQMPSGEAKYASGYYIDTISGYFSCDSVVEVQLEIRSSSLTQLNYSACDSLQTPFGTFKRSGNYQYFFKRWNTCDSIISLDVKVNKPKYSYLELDACDSFISPTGKTWKSSGIYKDTIKTYLACDSFITFDLSLGKTNFSNNSESACTEFISPSGKVLDQSGIYFDTISNSMSCDSIIRLDLKITKIDTGITSHGNTLLSAETNASFQWLDCLDGFIAINGETDSVFVAQKNGSYALEIQKNGCLDTTYCYTISGIGIFEEDLNNIIKVYPNPTNGKVILEIDGNAKSAEIVITDMYGKVVDKKYFDVLNKREIEIPGSKGIYFIKVLVDNDVFGVVKIVKR